MGEQALTRAARLPRIDRKPNPKRRRAGRAGTLTGDGAHGARNNERQFVRAAESVRRLGLE